MLAVALAFASATAVVWAEKIQFSKPAVAIATPPKKELDLPQRKSRDVDFSSPADVERPITPPPPVMRVPPREREQDDDARQHPLLREPKDFPDGFGRAESRNSLGSNKSSSKSSTNATRSNLGMFGTKRLASEHALSPIPDINVDLRDRDRDPQQRQKDSAKMDRPLVSDRNERGKPDPYLIRDNASEPMEPFSSRSKFDPLTVRPNETPDPQQLERRAAFDQLLTPGGNMVRAPGSLEPVTGLDGPKAATPAVMPMLGGTKFELNPADPANSIKLQQEKLRAPVAETLNRKYSQPTKPVAAGAAESPFRTSLMREPTVREIPARKF